MISPVGLPQPDPLPLPAPVLLLWALEQLTFLLHVLAMNALLGGTLLVLWLGRRGGPNAENAARLRALLAGAAPVLMAATVSLGVAPLLFVQVLWGRLFFTSSVLMAWPWLSVVALVIAAYYLSYALAQGGGRVAARARALRLLLALLLLAVAFLYVNNMTLMLRPDAFLDLYRADGRGLQLNLADRTLLPRYLHFVLGAVAVAAALLAVVGLARRHAEPGWSAWAVRQGLLGFAVVTGVNVAAGLWLLMAQPRPTLLRLVGDSGWAAALLVAGILLTFAALALVPLALQGTPRTLGAWGVLVVAALTLVTMLLLRDQARVAALIGADVAPPSWVAPQWGPIALFAVLLVAALGTVAWMVAALARSTPRSA